MEIVTILAFAALVAVGSFIQTLSGFAIAMIITGGATVFQLAPIAFTINVVSMVAFANAAAAIHGLRHEIEKKILWTSTVGVLLLSAPGLVVLNYLSENALRALEILLGAVITASAVMLVLRPRRLKTTSSATAHFTIGCIGGFLSGLFGAGGPPMVLHLYRQPLPFAVVRTTLLAFLGAMTLIRLIMETAAGNITIAMTAVGLICVPVSIVAALVARRYRKHIGDESMRRLAFVLLCVLGVALML